MDNIKIKGPVREKEFFEYLDKICHKQDVKKYILEFYNLLKTEDKKDGPTISKSTFGVPFKQFYKGKLLDYDVNRYLLKNTEKIGKADYFRYQFVNFVDNINIFENSKKQDVSGDYDFFNYSINVYDKSHIIALLNSNKKLGNSFLQKEINFDEFEQSYYTEQDIEQYKIESMKKTIFHELTHLLSLKTLNDGTFQELQSCYVRKSRKKNNFYIFSSFNTVEFPKLTDAFINGVVIINETMTDRYSKRNLKTFHTDHSKLDFSNDDVFDQNVKFNKKEINLTNKYAKFQYIAELMLCLGLTNNPEEYLFNANYHNPNISFIEPDKKINEKIIEYFSKEIKNCNLASLTQTVNNLSAKEKFYICIGASYGNIQNKIQHSQWDKFAQLAEAILLNNYCATNFSKIDSLKNVAIYKNGKFERVKTQEEIEKDKKQIKEFLHKEIEVTKKIKPFIIKPNYKLEVPGYNCRTVNPREEISEYAFVKNQNSNYIHLNIWGTYIEQLIKLAEKYEPEIIKHNKNLTKEYNAYLDSVNLRKKLKNYENFNK